MRRPIFIGATLSITNHMHIIDDTDNIYTEGSVVRLRAQPSATVRIVKYQQRVYFCVDTGEPDGRPMPYFENELLGTCVTLNTTS